MRHLARLAIGLVCWIVGRRDVRYRWLAHYLIGTGSRMWVTGPELEEAVGARCWELHSRGRLQRGVLIKTDPWGGKLFWLVGGWTAYLVSTPQGEVIRGVDRYDWHANKPVNMAWDYEDDVEEEEEEEVVPGFTWWWSPTSIPGWIAQVVRVIWPATREYVDIGHTGKMAISNGLWPWLGGTEFDTVIEFPAHWLLEEDWEDLYNPLTPQEIASQEDAAWAAYWQREEKEEEEN